MKQSIYMETASFRIISYGNGLDYDFINLKNQRSVFFQGDDASHFEAEIEAYNSARDNYEDALCALWHNYSDVSEPIK